MPNQLPADALVIGVYPSAFHVEWRAPTHLGKGRGVKALAVDVEPTVFWNGDAGDFAKRRQAWMKAVGFLEGDEPGQHGHIEPRSPSTNGSSGAKVEQLYLQPLRLAPARTAFTDVYPVFQVKQGKGEEGDAIRCEYDRIADALAKPACSLPSRISKGTLPTEAARLFGERIVADLREAKPSVVIGLGEEVWATLKLLSALHARSPVDRFEELYGDLYGEPGELTVDGATVPWLSLAHPGLLRGKPEEVVIDPAKRTGAGWRFLHARWASGVGP